MPLYPVRRSDERELDSVIARETALAAFEFLREYVGSHFERLEVAGSVRRGRERVHDLDVVGLGKPGAPLLTRGALERYVVEAHGFRAGERMLSGDFWFPEGRNGTECPVDIYFATAENFGMLMVVRTGSALHNVWMAQTCKTMGVKFAAGSGVLDAQGNVVGARTEAEVFGALGLTVPEPRLREMGNGEPKWMK